MGISKPIDRLSRCMDSCFKRAGRDSHTYGRVKFNSDRIITDVPAAAVLFPILGVMAVRKSMVPGALLGTPFEKGIPAAEASPGLNFISGSARTRPRRWQERKRISFPLQEGNPCRCVKGAIYPSRLRREHKPHPASRADP